jgi:uncharacterized membrane protein YvbJ
MKCKHCGAEIDNDSVFCYSCGKKVEVEKIAPQEKVENKLLQDRFSGLSIASLVTGILSLILSGILLAYSILSLFIGIMLALTSFTYYRISYKYLYFGIIPKSLYLE